MSAYSSISLMDQEHLSGWAVHLCVPDLSHLSSSPPFLEGSPVWSTSVSCLTAPRTPPFIAVRSREPWTKSAYCPGSLRWVGAGLKVTFPVGHSLPRFWVITAPLMLLPSPEETVPLLMILPLSSYFECVISLLVWLWPTHQVSFNKYSCMSTRPDPCYWLKTQK